jgi:hypothetical protein
MGASLVIKDNLTFGLREMLDKFKQKQGYLQDEVLSREAWAHSNRNCVFWLEFENSVKLLVEMQEKQQPHLEEIPLFEQLP